MIKRENLSCKFFPCHKGLEDCTFCYCPFYPCLDNGRGGYIHSSGLNKDIWSCENCSWIHKKKTVDRIFSLIRNSSIMKKKKDEADRRAKGEDAKTGIIIIGHGSKLHKANNLISKVVKIIKEKKNYNIIEPSYLQFHPPDLSKSIKKVIVKGCKKIIIVPFFLFNGNHVKRDIPLAIKKEMKKYPGITFRFSKSLGEDANISNIVFKNINEAIRECV